MAKAKEQKGGDVMGSHLDALDTQPTKVSTKQIIEDMIEHPEDSAKQRAKRLGIQHSALRKRLDKLVRVGKMSEMIQKRIGKELLAITNRLIYLAKEKNNLKAIEMLLTMAGEYVPSSKQMVKTEGQQTINIKVSEIDYRLRSGERAAALPPQSNENLIADNPAGEGTHARAMRVEAHVVGEGKQEGHEK